MVEEEITEEEPIFSTPMEESFDPMLMGLDLTKEEKLRTTALMLAIKYHADTIIHNPEMLRYQHDHNMPTSPTSVEKVVAISQQFEEYILNGQLQITEEKLDEEEQS